MATLTQATLPLFNAVTLEQHIESHLSDAGFVEQKQSSGPTSHEPGTWGKVEVLTARVKAGEPLWHPDDAKMKRRRFGWESAQVEL
jgi:hypothetical protein